MLEVLKKQDGMIGLDDGSNLPPIIYYHRVAPKADPDTGVTPEIFDRQMGLLKSLGFLGVTIECALTAKPQESSRMIAVTFDDGYEDNYQWAAPILDRYGFRGSIFCVTRKLGELTDWSDDPRWVGHRLMTVTQAQELSREGFEIGAHTRNHADLSVTTGEALVDEIAGSRQDLEEMLGVPVPNFCYPYGRFSDEAREVVKKAGFRSGRSTRRMRPGRVESRFLLPARSISGEMSLFRYALTVTGYRMMEASRSPRLC